LRTLPDNTVRVYRSGPLKGSILPPSSKYHTLRAILAAMLAPGLSTLYYPAINDDTDVLCRACANLGAAIHCDQQEDGRCILSVRGTGAVLTMPARATLDVGNAGAVLRLLLGICTLLPAPITFTTPYPTSLGRRPNADLLQALARLGVICQSQTPEGTLPITLYGNNIRGGSVSISGKKSSQYISSLLFLAPLLKEGLDIEIVDELTSASFIDLTLKILKDAGITVSTVAPYRRYNVPGMQQYRPCSSIIPGDYPSAAALLASVAIAGGKVTLAHLPEGDANGEAILRIFSMMGLHIVRSGDSILALSDGHLQGITCDGNTVIDSVPAIVAAACFADGPSHIYNVANLHLKESDRINDLAMELNKAGCHVLPAADTITINPAERGGIAGGVNMDAHADHRLIESFTAVGLGSRQPVTISNAHHIAKSYPCFFDDLIGLGAKIERVS
jgi:3-phosphoshikimate 1-carboxyvinyltransferase